MKKYNWGIIGTGNIAKKFADTINNMPDSCCLYAVGSRTQESANAFAAEFNIPNAYGSYEQLVSDSNIDIIYISTPHTFHFENTMLCIENGKNVLCEKPFTVNAEEAKIIFAAAKKKNVFVMEAFWTKFLPLYKKVNEILDSGIIGDIVTFNAQYGYTVNEVKRNRRLELSLAGGALLDIGVYTVGLTCMLFGYNPISISSALCVRQDFKTDYFDAITLKYKNDMIAQLSTCIGANLLNEAIIFGKNGCIRIPRFNGAQECTLQLNDGSIQKYEAPFLINGFEYQVAEAINCIENNKIESDIMKQSDTLAVMTILDTVRKQNNYIYPFEIKA